MPKPFFFLLDDSFLLEDSVPGVAGAAAVPFSPADAVLFCGGAGSPLGAAPAGAGRVSDDEVVGALTWPTGSLDVAAGVASVLEVVGAAMVSVGSFEPAGLGAASLTELTELMEAPPPLTSVPPPPVPASAARLNVGPEAVGLRMSFAVMESAGGVRFGVPA